LRQGAQDASRVEGNAVAGVHVKGDQRAAHDSVAHDKGRDQAAQADALPDRP
jgi:hypothetical protein